MVEYYCHIHDEDEAAEVERISFQPGVRASGEPFADRDDPNGISKVANYEMPEERGPEADGQQQPP